MPVNFPPDVSIAARRRWYIKMIASTKKRLERLKELNAPELLTNNEQKVIDRFTKELNELKEIT